MNDDSSLPKWFQGSVEMGLMHEDWRGEYEQTRYLREVSDDRLARRLKDLCSGIWSTDQFGKPVPTWNGNHRNELLRLILHTLLEQAERVDHGVVDFNEGKLRRTSVGAYNPPKLTRLFTNSPSCYSKFGKRQHILDALDKGRIRIAPASIYDDPSLNSAQNDNELEHLAVTPNEHMEFRLIGLDEKGKKINVPAEPKELFRYMMVPNFYVWCCGLGYSARLFEAFQADAVLIIRDQVEFSQRLSDAVAAKNPCAEISDGPVNYYDPYTIQRRQLMPIFSKHIRYLYQNEYRIAWTVPAMEPLKTFFVDLGPLHDIAEMYELSTDGLLS
jgi:hypothetical protein